MSRAKIRFTYRDYRALPESETARYELLDGDLVMVPSPTFTHQRIVANLMRLLQRDIRQAQLGMVLAAPLDVVLGGTGEEDVVQPDVLFISRERMSIVRDEVVREAPDLVVEVLSPATASRDRTYKRTLYARHGVKEYWLVDPETRTVEVLVLGETGFGREGIFTGSAAVTSSVLPGLQFSAAEAFE
jgi:Uma2 family endonuclease